MLGAVVVACCVVVGGGAAGVVVRGGAACVVVGGGAAWVVGGGGEAWVVGGGGEAWVVVVVRGAVGVLATVAGAWCAACLPCTRRLCAGPAGFTVFVGVVGVDCVV